MAHPCINCGGVCYCSFDIDDVVTGTTPAGCDGCGCKYQPQTEFLEDDPEEYDDTDPETDPVGWECIGCMEGFDYPGDCPHCGNPLDPYG